MRTMAYIRSSAALRLAKGTTPSVVRGARQSGQALGVYDCLAADSIWRKQEPQNMWPHGVSHGSSQNSWHTVQKNSSGTRDTSAKRALSNPIAILISRGRPRAVNRLRADNKDKQIAINAGGW